MKYRMLVALLAVGLWSDVSAKEKSEYPNVFFSGPGSGKPTVTRDKAVILVIEGASLSSDGSPIPESGVVEYVNHLLELKQASYVAVYSREGIKYGDVVQAIDALRHTNAKDVGLSMVQIPFGRNP